jgi:thymidylate kinase
MIISLRGTHGSGKSTVMRAILKQCAHRPIYGVLGARLPEAYQLTVKGCKQPVFLIGPYQAFCGGCDFIKEFDLIPQLIAKYAPRGHVIFEGVIVASVYGRIGDLLEKWKKDSVFVFLDTSLEVCMQRVQARRNDRNDSREFDPKNLKLKYDSVERIKRRIVEDDIMSSLVVSSDDGAAAILKMLAGVA